MANFPASLLILNGKSADNQPLREAITLLRDEGIQIHVRVTWEKGDGRFWHPHYHRNAGKT